MLTGRRDRLLREGICVAGRVVAVRLDYDADRNGDFTRVVGAYGLVEYVDPSGATHNVERFWGDHRRVLACRRSGHAWVLFDPSAPGDTGRVHVNFGREPLVFDWIPAPRR